MMAMTAAQRALMSVWTGRTAPATARLRLMRPAPARRSAAVRQVALDLAALALFAAVAGGLAAAAPLAGQLPSTALFDLSRLWMTAGLPPLG